MTEADKERAAEVAKGLTEAQRNAVVQKGGAHNVVTSREVMPLWNVIQKVTPDYFSISLTPLGLAVRNHIKEQEHG